MFNYSFIQESKNMYPSMFAGVESEIYKSFASEIQKFFDLMKKEHGGRKQSFYIPCSAYGKEFDVNVNKRYIYQAYNDVVLTMISTCIGSCGYNPVFRYGFTYSPIEDKKYQVSRIKGFSFEDGVLMFILDEDVVSNERQSFIDNELSKFIGIEREYNKHYNEVTPEEREYNANNEVDFSLVDEYIDMLIENWDTIKLQHYTKFTISYGSDENASCSNSVKIKDIKSLKNDIHYLTKCVLTRTNGVNGIIPNTIHEWNNKAITLKDFFSTDLLSFKLTYNDDRIATMKYRKNREAEAICNFYSHYVVDHYTGD